MVDAGVSERVPDRSEEPHDSQYHDDNDPHRSDDPHDIRIQLEGWCRVIDDADDRGDDDGEDEELDEGHGGLL
jgi:hypothetical protein